MEGSRQDSDQDREIGRIVTRKRGERDQEEGMELSAGLGLERCLVKRSGEDVREPAAGEPSRGAHRVRDCAGMSCTGIEELASAVAELEESNHKLAILRAQGDTTHGTPIIFPTLGNKNTPGDNVRDKEKELQNLEACHKELTDLISQRLVEIKRLHEERIEILSKLATFQNTLRDCKSISSSKAFQVLKDQLQKSQTELDHCQTLLEKLQVDKDKFIRQEREVNVKVDLAGIPHRVSVNCESSIAVLEQNLQKMLDEKNMLVAKLEESSREPGRNQIISEFKALVSSLPREMGTMQSELSRYKDDASELHSLQAEVHSISDTLTRKLDFAVLKYRNQKLSEQLEVHKFEYHAFERKFDDLKQRQKFHHETKDMVNKSWEHLVRDLEAISVCKSGYQNSAHTTCHNDVSMDGAFIPKDKDFLSRLVETGAIHLENHAQSSTTDVLKNVLFSSNDSWHAQKSSLLSLFAALPENECSRQLQSTANELLLELNDAIEAFSDLHLKHKQLAEKYHNEKYSNARRKAEQKRLKEELATAVAELEESNHKLAVLRAQGDTTHGAPILFPTLGNRNTPGDNVRDKEKELQDLEACHKELTDLISQRLVEIKRLHEERIEILSKLATFQNTLTDCKSISSSEAFQVLKDQLQKSQAELDHCQTLLEKLQVDKDKFIWQEREINVKVDLAGIPHRMSVNCESSIAVLEQNLRKVLDEKNMLVAKLEESSREPGRNKIISEFKALVSSLPREMGTMQSELSRYKDDASELHSLRAEVHSLSDTLTRKEHAINESLRRSARAGSEIRDLQSRVCELRQTNGDLKLFMEMYKRESTDSSDVLECKNREYYEWAHVQSLKSFLDENRLEQRVKEANEAEATSQQRLAGGEAKIAELRGVMESSRREIGSLSELLKSKHEEGEAYLSEIESIGQAYEDVQTQNQQLLQQIIERDDHNTKIFMEGVKVKQAQDVLHLEVCNLTRNLQQAKSLMDLYKEKIAQLDDKLKVWSEQVGRLSEDGWRHSVSSGNAQRKLVDVQGEAQQLRLSLDQVQAKVGRSRLEVAGLLIELEKDRFSKRRIEDDMELMSRKASSLRAKTEASSVLEKVHQEVKEYRGILKCGVCRDRQKEVVITKCYHLFCNECIQRLLRNRQRRCPSCGLSFGANDVKPIYI